MHRRALAMAQSIVSLESKETVAVTVVFTITDDIIPQVNITEGRDPPSALVLRTALVGWGKPFVRRGVDIECTAASGV